jgi:hypothetical protein
MQSEKFQFSGSQGFNLTDRRKPEEFTLFAHSKIAPFLFEYIK